MGKKESRALLFLQFKKKKGIYKTLKAKCECILEQDNNLNP